jgi:hypothetical protein
MTQAGNLEVVQMESQAMLCTQTAGPKTGAAVWAIVLLLLVPVFCEGGYPLPAEAGFHHCALIYDTPNRSATDLMPYVAWAEDGVPKHWLFDAFLFLMQRTPSGASTTKGGMVQADWEEHLARWFLPGRDLQALDAALATSARSLAAPPVKRKVILSIPHPGRKVRDFGDVDGDGRSEDLSTAAGVATVMRWYVAAARSRFAAAGFTHLELWGFYWMHETISVPDEPQVQAAADAVHAAKLKLLWIPWFGAVGWDRWRACGIDVAIMQPNYAFFSNHRGAVRRNRLAVNADLSRRAGMGVEIELPMYCNDPASARYFLEYLADGAAQRHGYQEGATAYYLGAKNLGMLGQSSRPWQRQLARALARYVAGKAVDVPGARFAWTADGRKAAVLGDGNLGKATSLRQATGFLPQMELVAKLDVFLDGSGPEPPFSGLVRVDLRREGGEWHPGGWAIHPSPTVGDGLWQVVTVPLEGKADAVRVSMEPAPGSPSPRVREFAIELAQGTGANTVPNLARGCIYRAGTVPEAVYGDSGGELTDGVVPATGFSSGQTVGWHGHRAVVCFDFGHPVRVDRVEAHVEGGGYAGVKWPAQAVLMGGRDTPPATRLSGAGALPDACSWTAAGEVVIDQQRTRDAANGHLVFAPPRPLESRYLNLIFATRGWFMLSEVKVFAGDTNLVAGRPYTVHPAPAAKGNSPYADDEIRLTDGSVARVFSRRDITGWSTGREHPITLDLLGRVPCRKATVWSLAGGLHGIRAPEAVVVSVQDGQGNWREVGRAERPADLVEEGGLVALPYSVQLGGAAPRVLRATIIRKTGWAMVSEVQVE